MTRVLTLPLTLLALLMAHGVIADDATAAESERYNEPTLGIRVISSETTIEEQPMISGGSIRDGAMHWNVEMGEPLAEDSFALIEVEFRNLLEEDRQVEWKDFKIRSGGGRTIERPWGFRDDQNAYWPYDSFPLSGNRASTRRLLLAVERDAAVLHIRYRDEEPIAVNLANSTVPEESAPHVAARDPDATVTPRDVHTDGRLTIKLDKVTRSGQYPEDWRQPGQRYRKPQDGHDYVCVHFTVKQIEHVHVVCFGGRDDEKSILSGKSGTEYPLIVWNAKGVRFLEPDDMSSAAEFVEGATGLMIFECPKEDDLESFSFVYYFKNDMEDEVRKAGKIDIWGLSLLDDNE